MPTTTPLTDAINALTTYANTVTGASDTDLSSAVATLASGYGGGGGIVPTTKTVTIETAVTTGTNNAEALLKTIEPELNTNNPDGVFTFYTFDFAGNTITNKGAVFATYIKNGSVNSMRTLRTPTKWGGSQDFYVSAGTVVTVAKYELYTYGA